MEPRIGLTGDPFDLQDLLEGFGSGDPRILRDGDNYFLVAGEFVSFGDQHAKLLERAAEMLTQLDGAALLVNPRHRPVGISGTIHQGGQQHAVVIAGSIEGRSRVSAVLVSARDEPKKPALSPAQKAVGAASTNASVGAVLRLLGQGNLDWVNLYRILDYLAHEFGGKRGIIRAGLATADEIDRFGATANRIELSGDEARHGPLRGPPPTRSMNLNEARALILRLVKDWTAAQ